MKKLLSNLALGSLFLLCLSRVSAWSQAPEDKRTEHFRQLIQQQRQKADGWERQGDLQILLTISIIICGAAVTGLQVSKSNWSKHATAVLGIATTIFTGISAKVLPTDHRTLQRAAEYARSELERLDLDLYRVDTMPTEEARLAFYTNFVRQLEDFEHTCQQMLAGEGISTRTKETSKNNSSLWITSPVYAQARPDTTPRWFSNPPSDKISLYYAGEGKGHSLAEAKQAALDAAVNEATAQLAKKTGADPQRIDRVLKQILSLEDSSFGYDGNTSAYYAFALVRISREVEYLLSQASSQIRLVRVKIRHDGTPRPTQWSFDIKINGKLMASLPEHDFHPTKEKVLDANSQDPKLPDISVPSSGPFEIEVIGYQGHDRKILSGRGTIKLGDTPPNRPTLVTLKKTSTLGLLGWFEFYFEIS